MTTPYTFTCPYCLAVSDPVGSAAEAEQLLDVHLRGQHGWVGRSNGQTTRQ
ncbi:hypothetical protein [Frankia sp. R82]|uniref:hypothetical protein n=1 Tax=Frankia sp. R82 TaxID=2950553 RepID=UPI002043C00E|nr:hypothetical protein [Frankia sp. R82]MCM3884149.1 hypothetical protein [Frankia sp. R82]